MTNSELYHYGVKGMRWGQRKRLDNKQYRAAKKEDFLDSFKGSREIKKAQASAVVGVGGLAAAQIVNRIGTVTMSSLAPSNPTAAMGAFLASSLISATIGLTTVVGLYNINKD